MVEAAGGVGARGQGAVAMHLRQARGVDAAVAGAGGGRGEHDRQRGGGVQKQVLARAGKGAA